MDETGSIIRFTTLYPVSVFRFEYFRYIRPTPSVYYLFVYRFLPFMIFFHFDQYPYLSLPPFFLWSNLSHRPLSEKHFTMYSSLDSFTPSIGSFIDPCPSRSLFSFKLPGVYSHRVVQIFSHSSDYNDRSNIPLSFFTVDHFSLITHRHSRTSRNIWCYSCTTK